MKFKKGQKVKVVDRVHGHNFKIGDIVNILDLDPKSNGGTGGYKCELNGEMWWLDDRELKKIT